MSVSATYRWIDKAHDLDGLGVGAFVLFSYTEEATKSLAVGLGITGYKQGKGFVGRRGLDSVLVPKDPTNILYTTFTVQKSNLFLSKENFIMSIKRMKRGMLDKLFFHVFLIFCYLCPAHVA